MRVVIVGGGIAGLTLANALERAGIDFVILEARSLFDPQVGASIGLNAASMRIFDQLGIATEIMENTAPIKFSKVHRADGKLVMPPAVTFQILHKRFGYQACFLDRQLVLRALANGIRDKTKMLVQKEVINVQLTDSSATVRCADGSTYTGDLVVGCDGVNSKASIRNEMWRLARDVSPKWFPETDQTKMTADFNCLFGISDPVDGLAEGEVDTVFDKGRSSLVITGKGGRVYWFYHEKLDKTYFAGSNDFPRYSEDDATKFVLRNAHRHVNESVTLRQLWQVCVSYSLVPLEEALFEKWSWRRIATVGDSAHKMTPNHGQAGNNAVESAAALANQLKRLHKIGVCTTETIESALEEWQKKRQNRINATVTEAAAVARMQALDSRFAHVIMNYVVPNAIESLLTMVTDTLIGAEILEYLPVPDRSLESLCPFNPSQGIGKHESLVRRLLKTTPLVGFAIFVGAFALIDQDEVYSASEATSLGSFRSLADASLISSLWLMESNRRANLMTLMRFPIFFLFATFRLDLWIVCPIYYSIHYVFSSIEKFASSDARHTNLAYTRTIMPLMLVTIGVSLSLDTNSLGTNGHLNPTNLLWKSSQTVLLPVITIVVAQQALVMAGLSKVTTQLDIVANPLQDVPYIVRGGLESRSRASIVANVLLF
ncbi:hypothetical protein NLG97_g983 [Lecanicillium saksenae]|uniref:Uncharacterized protein n=1 Tax=Lecanicillium saksenae TaxID=468837 RepID=A0ACC1R6Z2_9HYPO|nr:hypothetical protein NLG97_g983 [Lecanicillium saksenae]